MAYLTVVQEVMVWVLPVLFAVTVHEVAHGWVANLRGDSTALMMGRLTLNPLKHIDIVGTVIVPISCLVLGGFVFGWAKPVPVSWRNLRKPRQDAALVAVAGPLSNLLMALLWAFIAKMGVMLFQQGFSSALFLAYMGNAGISINLMLMILNLLPIPPLDGSRVVSSLLPPRLSRSYDLIEPYGLMILVALIFTNILSMILNPPLQWMQIGILRLFGLFGL
ncbi:MAG TPA: site-2 protease family protein [Gammaproteobacteria bacterium]|mgnify:CR=1 FL=1|nr:site-2 protease family protein [Gammaproteobacteria bacterium]HQZ87361.1 site-2 protease family protein [Gammaproteobacteria bacterium]HRA42220.1 site-2 protease family protein [Gammaproteobacteria bacterium]